VSPVRRQRRRPEEDILQGELWKIKPPTFNGEHKKGKYVEALLSRNLYLPKSKGKWILNWHNKEDDLSLSP
jgi:hypothetical protein